jgi:phosphoglycerate dehydrogenase-like enzyme
MKILVAIYSSFAGWNIPDSHVERLRREFPDHEFLHARGEAGVAPLIAEAEVAFASELRKHHLAAARRLRWVHSPAVGIGGMLFPEMVASPVTMTNSRGVTAGPISEHVIAVVLAVFRKLPLAIRRQAEGIWAQHEIAADPPVRQLSESRVLLIGLGSIGAAVARKMVALGARVAAIRRRTTAPAPDGVEVHGSDALHGQLSAADVVVVTAPQTRATWGMIGAAELRAMRRDAIVVNVSRGKLIDEAALASALRDGTIGGAALDVFAEEPLPPDSPLWRLPNVLITPHTSWQRTQHWDDVTAQFAANLRRFEAGQPLINPVDKTAGY